MKPSFALSLSFEGIGLLHRSFPGWNRVGEVALDSPDLAGALAVLRETAQQINGQELTCKLVVPNDQIKYLALDLGLTDEAERDAAIRKALDGITPYPVDDLVFDWSVEGDKTLVAAVARETLSEAEQFASEHGFGPISFVATPPEGAFAGEPFFGPTRHAQEVLPEGEAVQRDMAPIRVTGVARLPEAEDAAEAESVEAGAPAEEETQAAGEAEAGAEPEDAGEAPAAGAEPADAPEPAPETPEGGEDTTPASGDTPEAGAEAEEAPDEEAGAGADEAVDGAPADDAPIVDSPADDAPADDEPAPAFTTIRAHRAEDDDADPAPMLAGVRRWRDEPVADDLTAPTIPIAPEDDAFPPPIGPTTALPEATIDWPEPERDAPPPPRAGLGAIPPAPDFPEPPDDDGPAPSDSAEAAPREGRFAFFSRRGAGMASGLAAGIGSSLAARSARRAGARAGKAPAPLPDPAPLSDPGPLPDPGPLSDPGPLRASTSEKERMTIFGARRRETETRASAAGKPRYLGLILTAVLLVFLAGVAAWASIFVDDGLSRFFGPRDTAVVDLPDDTVDELSIEGDEAMVPSLPDTAPEPAAPAIETAALETVTDETAPPPARAEPEPPRALTPDEAQARYAVTGVWLRAPDAPPEPGQHTLEELYVASIDPKVEEHDAIALPDIAAMRPDDVIARVSTPAARGSQFELDARGLVIASAAGTLSPEGFLVFAGRPELTPGPVPERAAPDAEDTQDSVARALLAAFRPRPRPEGLIEQNERQNLGGITWAEVSRVRPRTRPELDIAKIEEEADETGTAQAVGLSRKPEARPRNFARVVERAQAAPEPREATRVAAAVPRQQAVAPSVPSRSNVAAAATVRNQLNLRKVNLIGVYGKPNARRALVRLSNGRYQKVEVGDRLDGGRVQAIGETELRYQKNGRNVILQMPRG